MQNLLHFSGSNARRAICLWGTRFILSASHAGDVDTLTTPEKVVPEPWPSVSSAAWDGVLEGDTHRSRWRLTFSLRPWVVASLLPYPQALDTPRVCLAGSDFRERRTWGLVVA